MLRINFVNDNVNLTVEYQKIDESTFELIESLRKVDKYKEPNTNSLILLEGAKMVSTVAPKINLIKCVRNISGKSLKESKDLVEMAYDGCDRL